MVGTQAKATKKYLDKAKDTILKAIKRKDFLNLQFKLQRDLNLIPEAALKLVQELAQYEAEYTYKKIKKYDASNAEALSEQQVNQIARDVLINTSIDAPKRNIENAYRQFATSKARQYTQIVNDAQLEEWDDEELQDEIEDRTNGLFTTQNFALAGLALLSVASEVRSTVANESGMQVEWVLDLELNNCPYCEDMANGGPYDLEEVSDEVPAHSNCGCTLIPILGEDEDDADF